MTPRTDYYLSLCLEQASKSPLHYRHGCIVVRGGKVIGQGYNDYRPGFNGGALKSGRLASHGTLEDSAVAELKQKKKQRTRHISKPFSKTKANTTYTPFENPASSCSGSGGYLANTPLSMHSEMMAIYSALSLSHTLSSQGSARSAAYFQKPCYSLQNSGKRGKARLRGLQKYVTIVCGPPQADKGSTSTSKQSEVKDREHFKKDVEEDEASLKGSSGQKHRSKKEYEYLHDHQYYHRPHVLQQEQGQRPHKPSRAPDVLTDERKSTAQRSSRGSAPDHTGVAGRLDLANTRKLERMDKSAIPAIQTLLLPQGRTGHASQKVAERRKDPRLKGADLYVARLGWKLSETPLKEIREAPATGAIERLSPKPIASSSEPSASLPPVPRSLHDELSPSTLNALSATNPTRQSNSELLTTKCASASRPCYRCISYMESVGIKRIFWTNENGEWDGGKVRDLADALEDPDSDVDRTASDSLFVTKHEVLMLRRLMASS
ncbi:MAG: hypothetical protein M1836_007202 [Candelina mexicana]|nr:MAG: hypothetical protein M1836_007202 [Candelina mexicana]